MASFVDQPYQYSKYINTQPVEAMVKVGMLKQAQYDENVNRFREQLDAAAAIPVLRDVDKQHLQEVINSTKSNITQLGNVDFAENQIRDTVGGMISKISKDPYILAGVQSYNNLQNQLALKTSLQKEGKTSVSNDYDFESAYANYMNSQDLGVTFNHRYTPYTDVRKKAMEAIKGLHPNLAAFDIPFEMVDGKIDTSKIANAMKRYKIEGISETQIEMAIRSSLTPDDYNQLRLDANYQFRGVTSMDLANIATNDYQNNKKEAEKQLSFLKEQRTAFIGNTSKLQAIDDDIVKYELLLGKDGAKGLLQENYEKNLYEATTNPDAVKSSLYKEGFIKQFANAFKWQNQEQSLVSNPIKQQMNEDRNFALASEKFKRDIYESDRDYALKEKEFELKLLEETNKRFGMGGGGEWVTLGNETISTLKSVENFNNFILQTQEEYNTYKGRLNSMGLSDAVINSMLNEYEKNPTKNSINPAAVDDIQNMLRTRDYLNSLRQKQTEIRKQAEDKSGVNRVYSEVTKGQKDITVNVEGENITLTPKDVFQIAQARKNTGRKNMAGLPITQNEYSMLSPVQAKVMRNLAAGSPLDIKVTEYWNAINDRQRLADQYYQEGIAPISKQFIPRIKGVFDKEGKIPAPVASNISSLITSADIQSIAADKNFSPEKAFQYLSEKFVKDSEVAVYQQGDKYEVWIKNKQTPKDIQKIRLDQNQVNRIFGKDYVDRFTQEKVRLDIGNGSTNIVGEVEKSFLKSSNGDFPNISKMNVTADLNSVSGDPGMFIPYVNIKKKDGRWQSFPLIGSDGKNRVGFEGGISVLTSLNDDLLLKMIKESYPNIDLSTLDIK